MTFEYRDEHQLTLRINRLEPDYPGQTITPAIWIETSDGFFGRIAVKVPTNRVEEVVAGIRDAARQATARPGAVCACGHAAHAPGTECEAGVEHGPKRWHRCLCLNLVGANAACPPDMDCQGGKLGYSDVWHRQRAATAQPDPTTADDPTPLRWGLGDILWGDDDTVIVCLSGPAPDRAPYWLELDPERANALRNDLTGPDTEPQDHPGAEHPMARALRLGAVAIPDAIVAEISEATNSGLPLPWPEYTDRDADVWHLTDETHDGDRVMLPAAGDMAPMLRRDVQRFFGPLTAAGLAAPTNHDTETELATATEPARQRIINHPGVLATADTEIAALLDEHRAEILNHAADEVQALIQEWPGMNDVAIRLNDSRRAIAARLRRLAAGAES